MTKDIRVAKPLFPDKEKILKDIATILYSGRLMNGKFNRLFEDKFSEYILSKFAIAVNSCTTAIEIVLRYVGIEGMEVIVPTNTFIATPNAVLFAGGKPVLADIENDSYCLDPEDVKRKISNKTKAVIAVHIAGYVSPAIEEIRKICDNRGIALIEDCAHAIGASYKGKMAGTFGLAGCFSFYPTKIITTGTGGMIVTDDTELDKYARSVRIHGAGNGLSDITNIGNDWFMDEIRSCLGVNQMDHLHDFLEHRRDIAAYYDTLLSTSDVIRKFSVSELSKHAYYKYPVQIAEDINVDELKRVFPEKYGFELESVYWPTCHLQPVYKKEFGFAAGDFPVAESILSKQVTLPLHADMTTEDAEYAYVCLSSEIDKMLTGK